MNVGVHEPLRDDSSCAKVDNVGRNTFLNLDRERGLWMGCIEGGSIVSEHIVAGILNDNNLLEGMVILVEA